ncbi:MAG: hypothetical protein J6I55_02075 [Ruminococcus sp.]|nr:hypothetical protein [Ruminococcus sp.]
MKKHKIFISTLLTLCIGAVPIQALTCSVPAMAYTFSKMPEIIEYNNMEFAVLEWEKSNELILLDYNGNEETLIVPETVE